MMLGPLKKFIRLTTCCFRPGDDVTSDVGQSQEQEIHLSVQRSYVGAFWDFENCAIPNGCDTADFVHRLRAVILAYGEVIRFAAYGKQELLGSRASELQVCGVEFVQVPLGKEMADKAMILDVMCFVFDSQRENRETQVTEIGEPATLNSSTCRSVPLCVVLITADSGFAPLVSRLLDRGVKAAVVTRIPKTLPSRPHPVSMRLLTSGADVHDWDGILSNGFSESVSSSAVHPTARTESEHVEEAEIRAAADCGLCRLDPARALFVEVSLTAVKKRAKQGFSDDEISLATLRCQVMTVLAASGRLSINMFDKAFCSLIGKPIRLADYGLRRLKDLGDVLPDVVQLNSAWSRFEKSRHLPSAVRERISQQRTLQLVSSPQNLRSLGLIQSRMRHLAHEALATVVADRGVMTSYCKGSGREGWLHIVSLQEELERRAEQPLCSLLIRHGFWEAGKQKSQLVWRFAALLQEMPDVVQMRVDTTGQVRVWPVGGPRDRLVTDWALQNPTWDGVLFQAVQLCTVTLIVQAVQEPVHGPSADVTITQEEGHAAAKSQ